MKDYFKLDLFRYYGNGKRSLKDKIFLKREILFLKYFRKANSCNGLFKFFYKLKLKSLEKKTHIQIPISTKIGKGFYIGHLGRIIINPGVIIGDNCNIATGVTIGAENRGKRKGCPKIGNNVWIGTNSVIVGNIVIGDDVLIAPLSYINFDVPSHSIVVGNPAKVISSNYATEGYIENTI